MTTTPQLIETVYLAESRKVFATLVRLLGDFDLAEEALHEAFAAAIAQWPTSGIPKKPGAWLISTGRFKAIDAIRRRVRFDESLLEIANRLEDNSSNQNPEEILNREPLEDDQLRLIFTCCHPALAPDTQIALTLREVCGLSTEEIASAFLLSPATVAQRIVRGKAKIRDAKIPYHVPQGAELAERLESVLSVIYLVFNEGYSASSGSSHVRSELSNEAIRLCRLLSLLLPDAEVLGLLALMLFHESRRLARTTAEGDVVLLEDQDRSIWNRSAISEGQALIEKAFASGTVGAYTVQAASSGTHAAARTSDETNWPQIVSLYNLLLSSGPSPIVELNRAVAIAMRDGPRAGLELIDSIFQRGDLLDYHLAHAAKADLLRRLGETEGSKMSYQKALSLARQDPERRFLEKRILELS